MTLYMLLEQLAHIPKSMLPVEIFRHLKNRLSSIYDRCTLSV